MAAAAMVWIGAGCAVTPPGQPAGKTPGETATIRAVETRSPTVAASAVPGPTAQALPSPSPVADTEAPATGLSPEEAATLRSLRKIDDHPFYTMNFEGGYPIPVDPPPPGSSASDSDIPPGVLDRGPWACSLFASRGSSAGTVYGRNFDWDPSPALLLFTHPPGAFASASMVDIAYLVGDEIAHTLDDAPLGDRAALLDAPYLPFDGMNERGLIVGMAAVPGSPMDHDPGRRAVDSLMVIRLMLDFAANVNEAVAVAESYNIEWGGGPPLHYLVADADGEAALVEFIDGETIVLRSSGPYYVATNHLRALIEPGESSGCWRYDLLSESLRALHGDVDASQAMSLLEAASVPTTQWSAVYSSDPLQIDVVMGRSYDTVHEFLLSSGTSSMGAGAPVEE